MKNIFVALILISLYLTPACSYGAIFSGGVSKVDTTNRIVDSNTNKPIPHAKISMPKYNYTTYSDDNGNFDLKAVSNSTILSVEKQGYRPFSATILDTSKPLNISIEKSNLNDIVLESNVMHLGDDNYSSTSANAGNFRLRSSGPFFSKNFLMKANTLTAQNYLIIGSILGIDTLMARAVGQNRITNSYASAPEVYFNNTKIAEIQLNGDNQKIRIPNNLIRPNQQNEITIKTGRNLMQKAYVDYDDIEIANLSILSE